MKPLKLSFFIFDTILLDRFLTLKFEVCTKHICRFFHRAMSNYILHIFDNFLNCGTHHTFCIQLSPLQLCLAQDFNEKWSKRSQWFSVCWIASWNNCLKLWYSMRLQILLLFLFCFVLFSGCDKKLNSMNVKRCL